MHPVVVSFVVPTYNQPDLSIACFSSIRANIKTPHEIVWVDNGSTKENIAAMRRAVTRPRMRAKLVKFSHNMGFVKATNAGIKEAVGKYIILLNNDTKVGWTMVKKLIKPFASDPKIGAVGPVTNSLIGWQGVANLNRRFKFNYPSIVKDYDKIIEKKFKGRFIEVGGRKAPLSFFCCCIKKEVFDRIGLLDENFGIGLGDDDDFALRMAYAGFKQVLALDAYCMHLHRTTFNALNVNIDAIRRRNIRILKRNEKKYKSNGI